MKLKKLLCFITTAVTSVTALASNTFAYYDGSDSDTSAYMKKISGITYVLKENVQYGDKIKIPYSASVVEIPNAKKVEIPEKISYDGLEFIVTDIDLCGELFVHPLKPNNIYSNVEEVVLPDTIYNITRFAYLPNVQKLNIPKNAAIGRHYAEGFVNYDDTGNKFVVDKTIYYSDIGSTRVAFSQFIDEGYYFYNCPKLTLTVDSNNPYYKYENNLLLSKDGKEVYLSLNHSNVIEIPEGVESINSNGGFGFYDVEKVKLPSTLKYFGGGPWKSLLNVSLPNGLEKIGPEAFINTYFDKIVIPDSVKEVCNSAFDSSTIKSVKFGKGLKTIGTRAFARCNNLKSVTLPKNLKTLDSWAFKKCKNLEKVKILSTDAKIGYRAFEKCTKLKSVKINKTKEIINHAFSRCSNLKTVTVNEVKKINAGAFYKCKKLSKVKIGNKKKAPKIEKRAFKGTKKGIKFYVKNKKVAKSLKKQLKGSGVKNAKILVGKKVIYKNVNS